MTDFGKVEAYYEQFDEWGRLDAPAGKLEFERALALLDRHLPHPCRVLDLGGGPGRYTIALAQRGHRVVLADLSFRLLDVAKQKFREAGVENYVEAMVRTNATDLSQLQDTSFDAVVAFGPFYHLTHVDERARAACEVARVLKVGGMGFATFIPRLSGLVGLIDRATRSPDQVNASSFGEAATTGVFRNLSSRGFQEGCYPDPKEMIELLQQVGLTPVETASLRGIANMLETQLETIRIQDPPLYVQILKSIDATATDASVIGMSGHAVCVVRKQR